MKILLVGNYENNRQQSMDRFAKMLQLGLEADGHDVRLVRPPTILGRFHRGESGFPKWIGYLDRFILYPRRLRRQSRWADVVHICDQANAVYIPYLVGKPHVVTCHDILAIRAARGEFTGSFIGWSGRIYQRWILGNLRRAKQVACVSRQTAEEVRRVVCLTEDRLAVVPNAYNYPYRPMPAHEAETHLDMVGLDPGRAYFLHVGGNQWYKNRMGVLRLFSELVKHPTYDAHRLVMAGKPWTREIRQSVASLKLQGRVIERVEVSNETLRALYSGAEALLFPSLQEGFGWPIAEAQACGCPVVTSNRAPMTEVGGTAAIYIDPTDPSGAASKVTSALTERERWRSAGLENATRFSTNAMIGAYLSCYWKAMQKGCYANKGEEIQNGDGRIG